ncbi:MAG: AAA family ATPase [Desulfocapsaceae bacterium]|nr:AAA family ATPase [Desulfocapsaceae bacterium]
MIESIHIAGIATYANSSESLSDLSKFNFIYGSNGSGKTTITKVIADEGIFPSCRVNWKAGTKLQTMVYNRDFVTKNFNQSTELKGIFTLGEKNVDTLIEIATAKGELDTLTKKIQDLNFFLQGEDGVSGKKGELATLEEEFKNKCWAQKQKHDAKFAGAFEGFRGSSDKFKSKILQERVSNSAMLESLVDLEKRAETVFGPTPTVEQSISSIETAKVATHESNLILKKRVIGKEDVDIAAMIKKLGNSDWVREGRAFYESNETVCPFCQQSTTEAFVASLNEYFDETFEADSKAIDDLANNYTIDSARLQQQITSVIATPSKYLDVEKLKSEMELLDSRVTINTQRIASKKKEPSQIVELESIGNVVDKIKELIDAANLLIAGHNKMVANLAQEKRNLTAQVWKYLLEVELKADLTAYDTKRDGLNKAITGMTEKIASAITDKGAKTTKIKTLEKEATSIQPTIDGINALLSSFGFRGFSLAKSSTETCYKLIRMDGADARETLSEGEMSFITFLYFYHLLKGSDSETGMTTNRVVVFDDPVSSLDSDILFIVGSLIKGLFEEVRAETGQIKQVFVLTHNVYFHKEVTFNPQHRHFGQNDATFWIVRKAGMESKIQKHCSNPIKTSYELLWVEIRKDDRTNLSIQNTLRRILENYFKILGGWDSDRICTLFEGQEKLVCNSLFSWINDGSHSALDDLYASTDPSMVDNYLTVFRSIFEKTGHFEHYKMMMADAYVESTLTPTPP